MDTSATFLCLAVIPEQQGWCCEGTQSWKHKYFHESEWQEPFKNTGLAPTCVAGLWLGDSNMSWIKTETCWAILWCWSGFFCLFWGLFHPIPQLSPPPLPQDRSNNSNVQTIKCIGRMVASRPKQVRALLSSTWSLHHVQGQLISRKILLCVYLFLLFTYWGLNVQEIKKCCWNWNNRGAPIFLPTSISPFFLLFQIWFNWIFFCHSDRSTAGPRSQSGNPVIHWWVSDLFKVPRVTKLLTA